MRSHAGSSAFQSAVLILWFLGVSAQAEDSARYCYSVSTPDILSKEFTEAQGERKKTASSDLDLEKSMLSNGYYWVNGHWVKKGQPILPARSATDLIDSDGDGYDDFTEIKFHTDPFKPESTPEAYFRFKGSNQVVFYGTNVSAQRK